MTDKIVLLILLFLLQVTYDASAKTIGKEFIGADVLKKYSFHVVRERGITDIVLPTPIGLNGWGLKQNLLKYTGYDLSPYAGKKVKIAGYDLAEKWKDTEAVTLWIVSANKEVIGAFLCVTKPGLIPGVFAVDDRDIK